MASLIPGYEYDIFISYRQKDNKYDGWVTEFVDNLKRELEATFKEEISVYFDINPHDGLLETHDVDASLKEKLKCLIIIPIISRTYCDPKSFAWEHEFKAFVELASNDQFGLKVKLPNGNVSNRVLPVRIHDLDANDIQLCESALGGVLRGVEFIYKEPGVNRSLTPKDKEKKNLNATIYRNQINKVALAIKEIFLGMQTEPGQSVKEKSLRSELFGEVDKGKKLKGKKKSVKLNKRKLQAGVAILAILIIAAVIAWPNIFKRNSLERLGSSGEKISIAVMPFQNLTNDTTCNILKEAIQMSLISTLSNTNELKVRQKETISSLLKTQGQNENASLSISITSGVSKKLDADIFIYGNIQKAGSAIRLNAQVIDTKTNNVLKSIEIKGPYDAEKIFIITDSLIKKVTDYLLISKLIKENPWYGQFPDITRSPDAYRYFIYGEKLKNTFVNQVDLANARDWYLRSIAADSNFLDAMVGLKDVYNFMGKTEEALKWILKIYKKKNQCTPDVQIGISWIYADIFESPEERIKYLNQGSQLDDQNPTNHWLLGNSYSGINQYEKAIPELEKAIELLHKWGVDDSYYYRDLADAYHKSGQFEKEKRLFKKAEKLVKDDYAILSRRAVLALTEKDTVLAKDFFDKIVVLSKNNSISESDIAIETAWIYWMADIRDKAEKYFRKALSLDTDNPGKMNTLANRLFDMNKNYDEAYQLLDKAIKSTVNKWDSYDYMDSKGMGLYKQGKYQEALEVLQKMFDSAPYKLYYMKSHLEEVKKAVAGMK
jgi:tetratricopeptide (TPR) repeat protein